jgi:hypothetical protein
MNKNHSNENRNARETIAQQKRGKEKILKRKRQNIE